ncbi:hypothetical protein [Bacillus alkalisoli]|uniref:hypothetical protein n=1 Tax=Bacillus alkalisoli TaxID=2011008 RepID=UPI000C246E21|nr:hypothetical protein [Bacillus alkalisoli]
MFVVKYFENKNLLLSQLVKNLPTEGSELKIKGKKGKIESIVSIDEKNYHVQVTLDKVVKSKFVVDNSKKKKR